MKNIFYVIALLFILGIIGCSSNQTQTLDGTSESKEKIVNQIDEMLQAYHDSSQYNGTVLIADEGEVIYSNAFGVASMEEELPMKLESQFYLASVAKQMTCMGIMILENNDQLDFDDKIRTFFPDLPAWADEVSVRNMMNHTSGIPDYYEMDVPRPGFTNTDVYQALLEVDTLDFSVGSDYSYSNSAYVLLSMIISEVSGKSFGDFMSENIFSPLKMEKTLVLDQHTPVMEGRAVGYTLDLEKDDYEYFTTGGGGIFSNVEDVFKWEQALYTDQLIPLEKIQQAYRPAQLSNDSLSYYGFGWRLDKDDPNVVQHSGSLNGFRTYLRRELDKKHAIILLTNHSNQWLSEIQEKISEILNSDNH